MIRFCWGKGDEARRRRLDKTLEEIAAKLDEKGRQSKIDDNEDFGNFFPDAAISIVAATKEDKRKRFRDLLYNSMLLPPGDTGWEESMHCLELLQAIEPVGLYCLARIARAEQNEKTISVSRRMDIAEWVTVPRNMPSQVQLDQEGEFDDLQYSDVLIIKNLKKITR